MRVKFDPNKSKIIKSDKRRGISFEEAKAIFENDYAMVQKNEVPEQYLAIGRVGERMFSVVFEIREDWAGEYYHLVTLWKSTKKEINVYEENYSKER